jgi:MFS family permease
LPRNLLAVLPTAFLFGGFLSTLYPVSVAYAHDSMHGEQVVAVTGRLILLFGLGSILGPLLGTSFVMGFGINGLLYLIATVALLLALFAAARSLTSTPPPDVKRQVEPLTPQPAVNSQDDPPVAGDHSMKSQQGVSSLFERGIRGIGDSVGSSSASTSSPPLGLAVIRDDEHSSIMGLRNRFKGNLACRSCMEKIGWVHEQCNPLQASAPVWLLHWRGHLPR